MNKQTLTPNEFVTRWKNVELTERAASQSHFIDLCRLLGEPTPIEADPIGNWYCFDRGVKKDMGGDGWADVWKKGFFAWEYKGKKKNLDATFIQLRQYQLALENPPLLIVSDMERFRIQTAWTNTTSMKYEFALEDLKNPEYFNKLKWVFSDPEKLRPGKTRQQLTEEAAGFFADLADRLRNKGHEPQDVAHFVNRLIFCMFAEDIGLLNEGLFTKMIKSSLKRPSKFEGFARQLFGAMSMECGEVGFDFVEWFNGGLFNDDQALPLSKEEIEVVYKANLLDWSEIDPSVFGTLFERGLDPSQRTQLGAHYTDHEKIMQIIRPVIIHPLLTEWEEVKSDIEIHMKKADQSKTKSSATRQKKKAQSYFQLFIEKLKNYTVLDPACGSGNFLYLALRALKEIEVKVSNDAEVLGLGRHLPVVGPHNLKGIEINEYAAELARISIWIGEIQWMRENGFGFKKDPVLDPLDNIQMSDAIVSINGMEPEWPTCDVIIGNPPFLGYSFQREHLGNDYVNSLRELYQGLVPGIADLVCYWFHKAGTLVASGNVSRAGLVATNSIREGENRLVLERTAQSTKIYNAWADEPWVVDGANVRVSLICFCSPTDNYPIQLNGEIVPQINSNLTRFTYPTVAKKLNQNRNTAFVGSMKKGPFDISGEQAREWLQLPRNPNNRPNSDVLKPWMNGKDVTSRRADRWIVDFGQDMTEEEAALYEAPFNYVREHVRPLRLQNNRMDLRQFWWRHDRSGQALYHQLERLPRFIATSRVAKHRFFIWLDSRIIPDSGIVAIARDDDVIFGILNSRFHKEWSLQHGTSLVDRPRYSKKFTFDTFPFPEGLSPDILAENYAGNPNAVAISEAARTLDLLRNRWLYPPEWVEWVEEQVPGYPQRPVPRNDGDTFQLKKRTLTNLYNLYPEWLTNAHATLDAAVASAYNWDPHISKDEFLQNLLVLNLQRLAEEDY